MGTILRSRVNDRGPEKKRVNLDHGGDNFDYPQTVLWNGGVSQRFVKDPSHTYRCKE